MPGLPEIDSLATYGGAKQNYSQVENPLTDMDALQWNIAATSMAAATHTVTRGWVRFTTSATVPALIAHDAVWGNGSSVTPVVARTGAGVFTLTFPTTVTDENLVTHPVNIRGAWGDLRGNTFANAARRDVTSPNVITVYTAASGSANDIAGSTIDIFYL